MSQASSTFKNSLILSALDRLVASNADGGISPLASHLVLLGANAGRNLGDVDNLVVIGAESLRGGTALASLQGSNVIGSQILTVMTDVFPPVQRTGPVTVIGFNDFPTIVHGQGAYVAIGSQIGSAMPALGHEVSANVLIGNDVLGLQRTLAANGGVGNVFNVIIGDRAARGTAFATDGGGVTFVSSVVIGAEACEQAGFDLGTPGTTFNTNVAIGRQALRAACSAQNTTVQANVAIGNSVASQMISGSNNVLVGSGVSVTTTGLADNIAIGANAVMTPAASASGNIMIGSASSASAIGSNNILIGTGCNGGVEIPAAADQRLLIQTGIGGTVRTILYGLMSNASPGGLVVGNSTAANRDVPGFNILKLINGTVTGVAPVGGGFLYSDGAAAGALHWVDTNNNNYNLTQGGLGNFTVATLPPAPPQGAKAYATNALAPAFGAAVAGGGAVYIPVFFNGAAWIVG